MTLESKKETELPCWTIVALTMVYAVVIFAAVMAAWSWDADSEGMDGQGKSTAQKGAAFSRGVHEGAEAVR